MSDNQYNNNSNNSGGANKVNESDQLMFNLIGANVVSVTFTISRQDLLNKLKDIAAEMLNDGDPLHDIMNAQMVYQWNTKYDPQSKKTVREPYPIIQVIIPSRNNNLVDNQGGNVFVRNEDTAKYSDKFKQFVSMYCVDDNKTAYLTGTNRRDGVSYRAIIVDINKLCGVIFDYDGRAYKQSAGINGPAKVISAHIEPVFQYSSNGEIAEIAAFKIEKSLASNGSKNMTFDVYNTRNKRRHDDDDNNRDNGKRDRSDNPFEKDFRKKFI